MGTGGQCVMILNTTLSGRMEQLEQLVDNWGSVIRSMWAVSLTWGELRVSHILF